MILDNGLFACDADGCTTEPAPRDEFEADGGVIMLHSSFFATRDEKHACSPLCAEKIAAELAHDMVAYGRRELPDVARRVH
jgi:hypothetical protein